MSAPSSTVDLARQSTDAEDPVLAALFARTHGGMRYDLACMEALLRAVGSPHEQFAVVQVAGTNGKGSTSALLARTLQNAGVRCGLFTSPHLLSVTERFVVDGRAISDAELHGYVARLVAVEALLPRPFSFFEACVAIACLAFARAGVAVAVMEAGLGGRLDATNVFAADKRLCCLLTAVDLDHQAILGSTRAAIAREKAALWRRGRPAISAPQVPEVAAACRDWATVHDVPLRQLLPADVAAFVAATPAVGEWPAFMQQNATVVAAACQALAAQNVAVTAADLAQACRDFVWPGRYHWWRLKGGEESGRNDPPAVVVDGGHNPAGCAALAAALANDPRSQGRRVVALVAALRDKDLTGMVQALTAGTDACYLCGVGGPRARQVAHLRAAFPDSTVFADVETALSVLLPQLQAGDVLVVTGSLVLAGEAMRALVARHFVDAGMRAYAHA